MNRNSLNRPARPGPSARHGSYRELTDLTLRGVVVLLLLAAVAPAAMLVLAAPEAVGVGLLGITVVGCVESLDGGGFVR